MKSHFDSARDVLAWANEAIEELHSACSDFLTATGNFREVREHDATTGENVLKVIQTGKIPKAVHRRLTEAISHTRHSFDQTLYAACWAVRGQRPRESVYFPWARDANDLEYRLGAKVGTGKKANTKIPPELWPVLRRLEPYGRSDGDAKGDDRIRELAQIANRKHTVKLTCGVNVRGVEYKNLELQAAGGSFSLPTPTWDAVKNEVVIARFTPDVEVRYNYAVNGYVALDEAGPLKGVDVVAALKLFSAKARAVLDSLEQEVAILAGE